MLRATWCWFLPWSLLGCGGDSGASADSGKPDGLRILSENTAAMCRDGEDNDDDGFPDCKDQDCWPLSVCVRDSGVESSSDEGDGGSVPEAGGGPDASDLGAADAPTSCVPQQSFTLAIVGPSGGSACSFAFNKPYTPGYVNLVLTPGWGTVCYAGSSQNYGSGASADGWWFSGDEIALCDATCSRFYAQTIAGKLTVRVGCPTENCTH